MVTTGDVGLPASALRSRYPQVTFCSIAPLFVAKSACVLLCVKDEGNTLTGKTLLSRGWSGQ